MKKANLINKKMNRRDLLRKGMTGLGIAGLTGTALAPLLFGRAAEAAATAAANGKILVILELSGGNDGLNTVVPYGDDAYYRQRRISACRRMTCASLMTTLV